MSSSAPEPERQPRRLFARFAEAAARRPDAPAFTFLGREPASYTFGELHRRAGEVAAALERRDLDRSAPLGLLLGSQELQTIHYLAALSTGHVPAILTPPNRKLNREYYAATTSAVLARSRFAAVVSDVESLALETPTLTPFTFEVSGGGAAAPAPGEPLEAAFLQFSSGTTGIKRGVPITADTALAQLDTYAAALELTADDAIVSWLPLYHDMGFIACLNMPLAFGTHTVMIDPIDWVTAPATFLRAASDHGATLSWNPNFAYSFMAQRVRDDDLDGVDLGRLRALVNCSEPVTLESQRRFFERFAAHGAREDMFRGCYAMAETTFALTDGTPADDGYLDAEGPTDASSLRGRTQVSVGSALPGVELRVVADDGRDLPDRAVGELWARSPFNFAGYHEEPEATTASHVDGWYRTGDLGYRVGAAYYVVGRKKDLLIVSGVNVFPQDLEDLVSGLDGVIAGRVSAFSEFDDRLQTEQVTLLFETDLPEDEARRVMITARQVLLASFQIANFQVHPVAPGWLVKSSSGKMARAANRQKWAEESARKLADASP